jgi:hypothetical protein
MNGICEDADGQVLSGLLQACLQLQSMDVTVRLRHQDPAGQQEPAPDWLEEELLQLELQQEEQQPAAQGWLEQEQQQEEEQEQQQQQPPAQGWLEQEEEEQEQEEQVPVAGLSLQQQEEEDAQVQLAGEAQPHATSPMAHAEQVGVRSPVGSDAGSAQAGTCMLISLCCMHRCDACPHAGGILCSMCLALLLVNLFLPWSSPDQCCMVVAAGSLAN